MLAGLEAGHNKYRSISSSEVWKQCVLDADTLNEAFLNIKEAISNMDKILIADILKYEIIDILENLENKLKTILCSGE